MSSSDKALTVTAADETAEISVIDGDLKKIARGVGWLHKNLPPGLYKLRVRVGPSLHEELVSLDKDREVTISAQEFPSPIPLEGTSRSRDNHRAAAIAASNTPRDRLGVGASILVFARDWSVEGRGSNDNPAAGLSLLSENQSISMDIESRAELRTDGDPCAGWRADVTPGAYRLRLKLGDGTGFERALFAAPNSQTQIFLLQRDHVLTGGKVQRRADLAAASMSISLTGSFDPRSRPARLSELASYALTQSHRILSDPLLNALSSEDFLDPMLGLLGAHLILRDRPNETRKFQLVTDNLRRLLGPDHPDLRALWLRRDDGSALGDGRLHTPPMLRRSWELAVEKSVHDPDLIPPGPPESSISGRILQAAPWLVWRAAADNSTSEGTTTDRFDVLTTALRDYVGARDRSDAARLDAARPMAAPLGTRILQQVLGYMRLSNVRPTADARSSASAASDTPTATLNTEEKAELARMYGVPGHVLDAVLQRISH